MKLQFGLCLVSLLSFGLADEYHPKTRRSIRTETDEDKYYWYTQGQNELNEALQYTQNTNVARNVILFIGDGMGVPTVSAARIHYGQLQGATGEEQLLAWEQFPNVGFAKTYNVDSQVPDSAGTATAFLSGSKTSNRVVGLDARVTASECEAITNDTIVESILKWSQEENKRTGVVTSARITHATPACAYAHTPNRLWECDADLNNNTRQDCPLLKDIAMQLVENQPGKSLNVILGGGYQYLDGSATDNPGDPVSRTGCLREDGRSLWQEWLDEKTLNGYSAEFVRNRTDLLSVDTSTTEYLMGIFANDHLPYEYEKQDAGDFPSLAEMTQTAIELLSQEPNGYFLLVESARIDHGHHDTTARKSLEETISLHQSVEIARNLTNEQDTLIIVTADHSHTMSFNGYPTRGNPILGIAGIGFPDLTNYTTLTYASGPGFDYTAVNGSVERGEPSDEDTESYDYEQLAAVRMPSETHAGEDVAIYAIGPMSHLIYSVHEQSYIAHAMGYASCVGSNKNHCAGKK